MFTFRSDIPVCVLAWPWLLSWRVRFVCAWWLSVCPGRFAGVLPLSACGVPGLPGCSWRVLFRRAGVLAG